MSHPVDRRSTITAILGAEGIATLAPGQMANGLAVSADGLKVRVTVVDAITPELVEVLRRRLALAAAVLRANGIPVLEVRSGFEITVGTMPIRKETAA